MIYNEIVKKVATKNEITQKDTKTVIDSFVEVIAETLTNGEDVKISGLGTFKVVEKAGRSGVIQMGTRKGETYTTEPSKGVKFSITKTLKDAVKNA